MSLADVRREYAHAALTERDVDADPIRQFERWMGEVQAAHVSEPTAMTLATASSDGTPSARVVLLKGLDSRGFVFYTDYRSHKGQDLEQNPRAALVFYWAELERQVRITGMVARITREESASYFETRPLASRLSAWASHQSAVVESRAELDARAMDLAHRYDDGTPPPLPPYWGGFRVAPDAIEFWQGRRSRLHDRLRYTREPAGGWRIERLSP